MKINIDKQNTSGVGNGTIFHYGTLTNDQHVEFPFTVVEMITDNPRWSETELTWAGDEPLNAERIGGIILEKFDELSCGEDLTFALAI